MVRFAIYFVLLLFCFCRNNLAEEEFPSKRILMEDNYYQIVQRLETLERQMAAAKLDKGIVLIKYTNICIVCIEKNYII